MDRNSIRTSVVIEVANQEEPEDQKTYHIDFDDIDVPKDYVIDQVFCSENITVYALFEVPEDFKVSSSDQMVDVTCQNAPDGYRFLQRNSSKKIMNHRKLNGFKQNPMNQEESTVNILPNKENENRSFYCLKHLGGDYDILTPERENSELKVLYCKNTPPRNSISTKFKAVSKGVNTDIVQSPRIIHEVQKVVRQNLPSSKLAGVKPVSSNRPSYEVIEMEMRQSFSSLSSYADSRKQRKKSVPNFFLVPLLMMDDGVLSHFQSDTTQNLLEEDERKTTVPEKVSMGTNTEILMSAPPLNGKKQNENVFDVPPPESVKSGNNDQQKQFTSNSHEKLNSRNTILREIKKLQGKLDVLIKSIESEGFYIDTSEPDSTILEGPPPEKQDDFETTLSEFKQFQTARRKYDDLPILSSLTYPQRKTRRKKHGETPREEHKEEAAMAPTKSNSVEFIPVQGSSKSQITRTNSNCKVVKSKEDMKALSSKSSIVRSDLENRRAAGLSKSATNGLNSLDCKFSFVNGIKKSFSFDLRDVKLEVTCLKKIKNNSFKLNIRIPQKGEAIMKCEMGDEACNKPKTSKTDLSLSKSTENVEDLKLEKKNFDSKKILKEEEGDAKLMYSKQNLLTQMIPRESENIEVHFCNSISTTPKNNLLPVEKSVQPIPFKSKGTCSVAEVESKAVSDADKPTTPGKTCKRPTPPNANAKKEVKTVKKFNYQPNKIKPGDKTPKTEVKEVSQQEAMKQRSVTGSRKFTLKGTADSKLHVDRLMKSENSVSSKTDVEKPGTRTSRLACQKRDSPDLPEESKEKTSKTNSLVNKKENSPMLGLESIGEENSQEVVPESSGVVVELLSEKPNKKLCPDESEKCTNLINTLDADLIFEGNTTSHEEVSDESLNPAKPVVKSVWALTKVLLFEDGSKKIEILEASLTPPGYSLPKTPVE